MGLINRAGTLLLAVAVGTASLSSQLVAQDKKDTVKQKEAVAANLKKADLSGATIVETENFLVVAPISKDKARALGAVLEKVVPVARKAAQFEEKEEAWKGKLAVYYLPEGRDFKGFIRNVVVGQPDGVHYDLRTENPFVADPVEVVGKVTEAEQFANTAAVVAEAYLRGKAGTAVLPAWLQNGFGRVVAMRAEGLNSKRYLAHRSTARLAVLGGKGGKPAVLADLWAENKPANADVIANSFAEYLAYGPAREKFLGFVSAFRANEDGSTPTTQQALESAGWKDIAMLEAGWRKWVQTGK